MSFPVVEAATHVDACRLLSYRALWLADQGEPHTKESAMVKWWGPKLSLETIHECLLLHGHYGYTQELLFEQRLRDIMGLEIGGGTAQIRKVVIARGLMDARACRTEKANGRTPPANKPDIEGRFEGTR